MNQKKQDWTKLKKIATGLVDVFLLNLSIGLSYLLKFGNQIPDYNFNPYREIALYLSLIFIIINILFGVYVYYNKTIGDTIVITLIIQFLFTIVLMALTFFARGLALPRSVVLYSFVISTIILSVWRWLSYKLYQRVSGSKSVIVVGDEKSVIDAYKNISEAKNKRHRITTAITSDYLTNLKKEIDKADIVYVASDLAGDDNHVFDLIIREEKKLFLKADFKNLLLINPNIMNIDDESMIEVSDFKIPAEDDLIKRTFDIVVSLILLILSLPITLITGLLVKLTSRGPVFYSQIRITKDQKEFKILKFRTMENLAEKKSGPVLATSNDSRVTGIGKYLRALRLDEIPQLLNVLKGDMSIVGPRPERPFFVDQFNSENASYYLRHKVRAGITGYAQVYGKYASDFNNKLKFDLIYIKNYSLVMDVKIMFQTIKILFDKVSSSGVEEQFESMTLDDLKKEKIRVYN
ncbi:sugar transferase [uncultured Vagococcus sp.]|uniref:sugar transferase n=1 Tax=uncultured Vagococcus sp. TaxID=189676 RepID=UPI0028D81478|nr:sugar transferase [uncultured Vagococcus sp.]